MRSLLLLLLALGWNIATAATYPEAVGTLARAHLQIPATSLSAAQRESVQAFADDFFDGFLQPDAVREGGSIEPPDAFSQGQRYWHAHPERRESILLGYGYARVRLSGKWVLGFEVSLFVPDDKSIGPVTLQRLPQGAGIAPQWKWGDSQENHVFVEGFLGPRARRSSSAMPSRRLLAADIRLSPAKNVPQKQR